MGLPAQHCCCPGSCRRSAATAGASCSARVLVLCGGRDCHPSLVFLSCALQAQQRGVGGVVTGSFLASLTVMLSLLSSTQVLSRLVLVAWQSNTPARGCGGQQRSSCSPGVARWVSMTLPPPRFPWWWLQSVQDKDHWHRQQEQLWSVEGLLVSTSGAALPPLATPLPGHSNK
jgi:hypothetical protein